MELLDGGLPAQPRSSSVEMLAAPERLVPEAPGRRLPWRRLAAVGVAAALGVVAGSCATSAHDAASVRTAAATATRGVVDLVVLHASAHVDDDGHLLAVVTLRNRGPRPIAVREVRLAGIVLQSPDSQVGPGELWAGSGTWHGRCPGQRDVEGPLSVTVRTADGVQRGVTLQQARDFLLETDGFPSPASCRAPEFDAAYVEVGVLSAARRGARGTRLVLTLAAQLPLGAQRARVMGVGVAEPGIVTRVVRGLPATVASGEPASVTVDVTAPDCAQARLPGDPTGGPFLWFRGRILPAGGVQAAPGYEANTVLVAVLRMLARACPGLVTGDGAATGST